MFNRTTLHSYMYAAQRISWTYPHILKRKSR